MYGMLFDSVSYNDNVISKDLVCLLGIRQGECIFYLHVCKWYRGIFSADEYDRVELWFLK